jgi:hypothetical protein
MSEPDLRLAALRRFAVAITVLNLLGHTVLGFEQSHLQPLIALATAYGLDLTIEALDAFAQRRPPRFLGGPTNLIDFLLPAHITGLAVTMLLYVNDRLWPVAFATAVAIGSKALFRAPVGRGSRHFLNPSNTGIAVTLLLFPWVSIAPPYQFTEGVTGALDWVLPGLIVASGTFLNARFTHKLPLIAGWVGGFAAQAVARSLIFGVPLAAMLVPMTGLAFVLFSYYMVTDPATTPVRPRAQVAFGAAVALAYAVLTVSHIVFGLFFALAIVCLSRGIALIALARFGARAPAAETPAGPAVPGPAVPGPALAQTLAREA